MRLPRDWSGTDLFQRLRRLGYEQSRQTGSHVRLTRRAGENEHHITVPLHNPLRVGTLNSVLKDVAEHLKLDREELLRQLLK